MELEKRKELARYLRHGDRKRIAEMAQVDRRTIYNWLTGKIKTTSAEAFIIEVARVRKEQMETLIQINFA